MTKRIPLLIHDKNQNKYLVNNKSFRKFKKSHIYIYISYVYIIIIYYDK